MDSTRLHYADELKSDEPQKIKQVIERFVEKVIVRQETIDVILMVTVHTTGGGGPLVDVCTAKNLPIISLYYTEPRP